MLKIHFIPIFDDEELIQAMEEYKSIWEEFGEKIVHHLENKTKLSFKEERIGAVVYEGVSMSGRNPNDIMKFRASYDEKMKKGALVHELSHRILFNLEKRDNNLDEHQIINLFLYDVWVDLFGEDFAKEMVENEKNLNDRYQKAWEWALGFNKEERKELFQSVLNGDIKTLLK